MVRALSTMWDFDPGAAVPGDWIVYDIRANIFYTDERLAHRYNLGCPLSGHQ